MNQDQKLVLPIAPADSGGPEKSASPALDSPKPASPVERIQPPAQSKPLGLTVSRQWVLPPRPKPGRKPKPKPSKPGRATGKESGSVSGSGSGSISSSKQEQRRTSESGAGTKGAANGVSIKSAGAGPNRRRSTISRESASGNQLGHHHSTHSRSDSKDDDSCLLCSRDDCMCETIGLKQSPPVSTSASTSSSSSSFSEPRKSLPSLDMILNGPPLKMEAVPLKRGNPDPQFGQTTGFGPRSEGSGSGITKFPRTEALRPVHPKHILNVPSPLEGLQMVPDSCGFCTENTPCACAEAANSAPTPPSAAQSPMGGSAPQMVYPLPSQHSPQPIPSPHSSHTVPTHPVSLPTAPPSVSSPSADEACYNCGKDAMSMLFCLSLAASSPLSHGAVSIPCHLAFKTLQKHPRFEGCDLGKLVRRLEVSPGRQVGVQSINRVLQDLERGEFISQ